MSDEWTDEEFLRYVEAHSETERALFSMGHVNRLLKTAGEKELNGEGFVAMHRENIQDTITAARKNVADGLPPLVCKKCKDPMRKFWNVGDKYYPCTSCGGELCEKCCDKEKS